MARSARLRLTLLYSGMFLALGTTIIVVVFLAGSHGTVIGSASQSAVAVSPHSSGPAVHEVVSQQHSADVSQLLAASWVTLVLTAIASAVLGWFLAGRVLRPLRQMTVAARTISAGNLHERLALTGPDDEFKQLGDTVDELLARLEASFAAQRRFVANAAHELRTPLTVERTLIQVALSDPDADAGRLRATCEELLASGRGHEQLLDSLLTLASSEHGVESRELLDLAELASSAAELAAPAAERERLEIVTHLRPTQASGDAALLQRLLANLIDNAVRYNHPDGWVEITTVADGDRALVSVANTGPPVPGDQVERLFEPFQRLGAERTASDGHRGLGLSIVRAIASAHGGTVTAQPRAEGGLIVTVGLPGA